MKNGLAIWHYNHRTDTENAKFFADNGFNAVSMHGRAMTKTCLDPERAVSFANAISEKNLTLTVHGKLPISHSDADVADFKASIDAMAKWQEKYGLIEVLSFDVWAEIRDNMVPYIEYVLQYPQFKKVAIEDCGVTADERAQLESLKSNERFGFLLDIGHMNVRLRGTPAEQNLLFINCPEECPATENPGVKEFLQAFKSKEFPIFEIHLHNNDGKKDLHDFLEHGSLDMNIIAEVLKEINFDGIVTIESVPHLQNCFPPESDERIIKTLEYWKSFIK